MDDKIIDTTKKAQTDKEGHLAKIKIGDVEHKVVNTVKVVEILIYKLENGQEVSQVIAHEFMMVDNKPYMVKLLTEAINTVMRAQKRQNYIKLASEALFNKLRGEVNLKRFLNKKNGRLS
jgi:hypothetical protein